MFRQNPRKKGCWKKKSVQRGIQHPTINGATTAPAVAIHAGIPGGDNNSLWHTPADPQASFHGSSDPARNVTFLQSPLPTVLLALVICCCQKKEEDRTHMYFSLLGEGAESAHGRTGDAPRPGWSMRWELAAAGDEMQKIRVKLRRMNLFPPPIRSPSASSPWIRSWTVLVHRDKDHDQWRLPARGL